MTLYNQSNAYFLTTSFPVKLNKQKSFLFQSMNRVGTILSLGMSIYQVPFKHNLRLTFPSQISLQANCLSSANFSYPAITDCEPRTANGKNFYLLKNIFERVSYYNDQRLVTISLNVSNFGGQGYVLVDIVGDVSADASANNPTGGLIEPLSILVV